MAMTITYKDIAAKEMALAATKQQYLVQQGWRKKPAGSVTDREWVEPGDAPTVETTLAHAVEMAISADWKATDQRHTN